MIIETLHREDVVTRGVKTRLFAICCALAAIATFGAFYQPVVVQGKSMAPALRDGQLVWMAKQHYRWHNVRRDDIVIFRHDSDVYIKRVYATAGAIVPIMRSEDGAASLLENPGSRQRMAHLLRSKPQLGSVDAIRVPPRCVFVVGDNRNVSMDSRDIGPIPVQEIVGFVPDPMAAPPSPAPHRASAVHVALR